MHTNVAKCATRLFAYVHTHCVQGAMTEGYASLGVPTASWLRYNKKRKKKKKRVFIYKSTFHQIRGNVTHKRLLCGFSILDLATARNFSKVFQIGKLHVTNYAIDILLLATAENPLVDL